MIYSYATTPVHDPQGDRVCLIRQKPGEYRDFTGLPHVCKKIYTEYTATLARNTTVTVRAEDVSVYVDTFYADHDGALKYGDLQITYTAYGEPLVGSSLCENIKYESSKLDVLQLLRLQTRLRQMRVSFECYLLSFRFDKPIYWDDLTKDFNDLFSAKPVQGPAPRGVDCVTSILPAMVGYFADKTYYELSVSARWPKPGHNLSYLPAIVFHVNYDPMRNPNLPFTEHWLSRNAHDTLAHTFWSVDEVIELEAARPRYDIYNMMAFLVQNGFYGREADDWFLNFQLKYAGSNANDTPTNAPEITEGNEASQSTGTSAYQHTDRDQQAPAAHVSVVHPGEPKSEHAGLPFLPFLPHIDPYACEEYQTITCRLPLRHYSLEELRVMDYHHGYGSYYRSLAATPPSQYIGMSEEEEAPSVFRELLKEAGLTLEDE
ncbi:hypothetical protein SLS60_002338 [Paraconiothyrium brasiliense]|uniref:Uncharacterized protein n=1 Tax=Paraconiothyrium brasiliense TaxID=300254 RepID=A0ABR3S2F1_9PLEO